MASSSRQLMIGVTQYHIAFQQVFELDQPLVLRVKNNLLSKQESFNSVSDEKADDVVRARIVPVEVDLSQAEWERELLQAGFDASLPSAWILEGLTM